MIFRPARRFGILRHAFGLGVAAVIAFAIGGGVQAQTAADKAIPHYDHIFVIMEENKDYGQIIGGKAAPHIAALARHYGNATHFYSEVHPSEANYVALLGGDTFGIHDDDAFYCKPALTDPFCEEASRPGYVAHTIAAPHLGAQLEAVGMSWKGYYENLPAPGSEAIYAGADNRPVTNPLAAFYAFKHSGFMSFAGVQSDPNRAAHIVGFDQLDADLASGNLPNFALIVPNQCNEMHGLYFPGMPADCSAAHEGPLIRRGDAETAELVTELQASPAWKSKGNMAIVITFDEGSGRERGGCCGVTPNAASNYGGGRIPTIVITNHGPRGAHDDTPYNHYSLLRTMEDAFGLDQHLGHAAETENGVVPMDKLFAQPGPLEALIERVRAALPSH